MAIQNEEKYKEPINGNLSMVNLTATILREIEDSGSEMGAS